MNATNKMQIVIVEDDHFQEEDFRTELETAFSGVNIEALTCESEFFDKYGDRPIAIPDIFIIDLMLEWKQAWTKTARIQPIPEPPYDEAGWRCLDAVRRYASDVPIIIWTITNTERVPLGKVDNRKTFLLRKDQAIEGELIELIKKL